LVINNLDLDMDPDPDPYPGPQVQKMLDPEHCGNCETHADPQHCLEPWALPITFLQLQVLPFH
jgi:hypothetical protein